MISWDPIQPLQFCDSISTLNLRKGFVLHSASSTTGVKAAGGSSHKRVLWCIEQGAEDSDEHLVFSIIPCHHWPSKALTNPTVELKNSWDVYYCGYFIQNSYQKFTSLIIRSLLISVLRLFWPVNTHFFSCAYVNNPCFFQKDLRRNHIISQPFSSGLPWPGFFTTYWRWAFCFLIIFLALSTLMSSPGWISLPRIWHWWKYCYILRFLFFLFFFLFSLFIAIINQHLTVTTPLPTVSRSYFFSLISNRSAPSFY